MKTTTRGCLIAPLLGLLLMACNGEDDGGQTAQQQRAAGMLSKAGTSANFTAAVKEGLRQPLGNTRTDMIFDADTAEPFINVNTSAQSFTQTYTLEANVDEADVVKYTGELLLVARDDDFVCCFPIDVASGAQPAAQVGIYAADASAASVTPLASIDLGEGLQIRGMYVGAEDTLAVLGTNLPLPTYGDAWSSTVAWLNSETVISLHNLEDPTAPQQRWRAAFDGSLVESRRIGDTLYLVSRFTPVIEGLSYAYTKDEAGRQTDQQLIDAAPAENLLPKIRINGTQQALVQPADCYIPSANSPDASMPNGSITTITAIPLSAPSHFKSTCYTGNAQGLYMSAQALYMVEQLYDFSEAEYTESTLIHKFALNGSDAAYRGSANIAGVMGGWHSMDFRLSEHDDYLRVVTSEHGYAGVAPMADAEADRVDHKLTVLRESATEQALEVVSTLPNNAHPQEIGKPDERLYGVRFVGERAYLVTFEQVDPLYVLDLSNPADPRIAGELEIPGFADFIHPVSEELILTLGKDANPGAQGWTFVDGLKVELFNVSDIANPQSISRLSIGGRGTDSEALYDRHAFTYAAVSEATHRFAIPIEVYAASDPQDAPRWLNSGLHLFEVSGVDTPEAAAVVQHGELLTDAAGNGSDPDYYAERRAVLHDDAVFFVDSEGVWSTFWSNTDVVQGPITVDR